MEVIMTKQHAQQQEGSTADSAGSEGRPNEEVAEDAEIVDDDEEQK